MTWFLPVPFIEILEASGLWRQSGIEGGLLWALSMKDISGSSSWLVNELNPADDIIVDMGAAF